MSEELKEKKHHVRTEIKDLARPEKELSNEEQKKIQGGATHIVGGGIRGTSTGNAAGGTINNSE